MPMKQDKKIYQSELISRLRRALKYPIGVNHFAVLMHGWMKKHPDTAPNVHTLFVRKRTDGELWLRAEEVDDLSSYAGYDLRK